MALTEIGPYRLLRLIGSGGEGNVYAAEDRRLGRRVAVKLRPAPADRDRRRAAVEEARMLAGFSHQLIVRLYDVIELPDAIALVMEFVPGSDLGTLMERATFAQGAVVQLALDICSALATAHANGVVHGDLKPSNVLLAEDGHIKLTDFGIAHLGEAGPANAGSLAAAAPEVLAGEGCDARSDLFGLGCLLYRLLAGRHPFPAGHYLPGAEPVPFADRDIHGGLASLVLALLAVDPQQRPASALDVRRALLSIVRDFPAGDAATLVHMAARYVDRRERSERAFLELPEPAFTPVRVRPRSIVATVLLVLLGVGVFVGTRWSPGVGGAVSLGTVTVRGAVQVGQEGLERLMRETLSAPSREAVGDGMLSLHVLCNDYVCSSQLVLQDDAGERTHTRALLPQSTPEAWRRRLDEGLDELQQQLP